MFEVTTAPSQMSCADCDADRRADLLVSLDASTSIGLCLDHLKRRLAHGEHTQIEPIEIHVPKRVVAIIRQQ